MNDFWLAAATKTRGKQPKRAMTMIKYWQDWLNYFLGLWLFGSPWFLEHSMITGTPQAGTQAMFSLWTVGLCVVLLTSIVIEGLRAWAELIILVLGAWLLLSPWILGFSASPVLMWNSVIVGALILIFAGWRLAEDRRHTAT